MAPPGGVAHKRRCERLAGATWCFSTPSGAGSSCWGYRSAPLYRFDEATIHEVFGDDVGSGSLPPIHRSWR